MGVPSSAARAARMGTRGLDGPAGSRRLPPTADPSATASPSWAGRAEACAASAAATMPSSSRARNRGSGSGTTASASLLRYFSVTGPEWVCVAVIITLAAATPVAAAIRPRARAASDLEIEATSFATNTTAVVPSLTYSAEASSGSWTPVL